MNRKLRKAVTALLATSALAMVSTYASAASSVQIDAGPAGSSASVTDNVSKTSWSFAFGQNYGWNHTVKFHDLIVSGGAGDYELTAKQTTTTDALPAFTLWSRTSGSGHVNGSHQFNQVRGPNDSPANKNTGWLSAAGINQIVGYGNAGATFTNGDGDAVGHGNVFDANPSHAQSGTSASISIAATGSSWTSGVDGSGLAYVTLFLHDLAAGTYLIYDGGSDFNNTSGKTTGGLALSVSAVPSAVPIPGSVWLSGSALAGLIGLSRRKAVQA